MKETPVRKSRRTFYVYNTVLDCPAHFGTEDSCYEYIANVRYILGNAKANTLLVCTRDELDRNYRFINK